MCITNPQGHCINIHTQTYIHNSTRGIIIIIIISRPACDRRCDARKRKKAKDGKLKAIILLYVCVCIVHKCHAQLIQIIRNERDITTPDDGNSTKKQVRALTVCIKGYDDDDDIFSIHQSSAVLLLLGCCRWKGSRNECDAFLFALIQFNNMLL
jgi:hypothetical protein